MYILYAYVYIYIYTHARTAIEGLASPAVLHSEVEQRYIPPPYTHTHTHTHRLTRNP